jgi:hypothetical protein
MIATRAPSWLIWSFQILRALGINAPILNAPIKTLYLTHLNIVSEADPDCIMGSILDFVATKKLLKGFHMLAFPNDVKVGQKLNCLKYSLIQRIPISLQQVVTDGVVTSTLKSTSEKVGFEMAVI